MRDQYPQTPGYQRRDTSKEAAGQVRAHTWRMRVLQALENQPSGFSCEQLADALAVPFKTIQPRFTELGHMDLVCDSGRRALNASGKKAIVWVRTARPLKDALVLPSLPPRHRRELDRLRQEVAHLRKENKRLRKDLNSGQTGLFPREEPTLVHAYGRPVFIGGLTPPKGDTP